MQNHSLYSTRSIDYIKLKRTITLIYFPKVAVILEGVNLFHLVNLFEGKLIAKKLKINFFELLEPATHNSK